MGRVPLYSSKQLNPELAPCGAGVNRPTTTMKKVSTIKIGEETFALFDSGVDTEGRLVNLRYLVSPVPNFKHGGAMLFLHGTNKAIAVDAPPCEIFSQLTSTEEEDVK